MQNPSRKPALQTCPANPHGKSIPQNRMNGKPAPAKPHPQNVFTAPSTNIKTNSHRVNWFATGLCAANRAAI